MADISSILDIKDIQDGVVITKSGIRAVLLASTINFALKSVEEQAAIISQYQNFLNSLDFPLEIVCSSRKLDITSYLSLVNEKMKEQPSELLRIQLSEYIDFVKNLTDLGNIMNQTFYVIVPFASIEKKSHSGILPDLSSFFGSDSDAAANQSLDEMKTQLMQRVDFVSSGLMQVGIKTTLLSKEELTDIYYQLYNPEAKEHITPKRPNT